MFGPLLLSVPRQINLTELPEIFQVGTAVTAFDLVCRYFTPEVVVNLYTKLLRRYRCLIQDLMLQRLKAPCSSCNEVPR